MATMTQANPNTPSRKKHHEINEIILKFNHEYRLELPIRGLDWSPQSGTGSRGRRAIEDKCVNKIKFIFHKSRHELERILHSEWPLGKSQDERTRFLLGKLDKTSEIIRTPAGSGKGTDERHTKDLEEVSKISNFRQPNFSVPSGLSSSSEKVLLYGIESNSEYVTARADSPITPTSIEENDFETAPESPTIAAQQSARRRMVTPHIRYPDLSPLGKRQFEDAVAQHHSEKYTRTERGRFDSFPRTGVIPREVIESFDSTTSVPTSVNTSFTSITTDITDITLPFNSSATIQSGLDNETMIAVESAPLQNEPLASSMDHLNLDRHASPRSSDVAIQCTGGQPLGLGPEPHQIRDLYKQGLVVENTAKEFKHHVFLVHFECTRIALANRVSPNTIIKAFAKSPLSWEDFWTHAEGLTEIIKKVPRSPQALWSEMSGHAVQYTLKGTVNFNKNHEGPLWKVQLEAPVLENSCRFQKKFGSDRFLYITFASYKDLTQRFTSHKEAYKQRFTEWLRTNHHFAGREWRVFHLEEMKTNKLSRLQDELSRIRVILFATSGCGLVPASPHQLQDCLTGKAPPRNAEMSIFELLNWFMPLSLNSTQPYLKAFARLDLGLSRTRSLVSFRPSQVRYIPDIHADSTRESSEFNDSNLDWSENPDHGMVMSDGCARVSVEAARRIWQATGYSGPIPSAFQARIGGAKGVWYISGPTHLTDDDDIWIEISQSQLKFKPHKCDQFDETFDPDRLTFELVSFSRPLKSAALYEGFLPILTDRGVPKAYISDLLQDTMDTERQSVLHLFKSDEDSGLLLQKWIEDDSNTNTAQDTEISFQGSFPLSLEERTKFMVGAGFQPTSNEYLAYLAQKLVWRRLMSIAKNFRLPLARSTNVIGIADLYGVLRPGEIHLISSKPIEDKKTGESWILFDKTEALVARNPALRRSDIQKVKIVCKPELRHLVDVVVFPSVGQYALASKLQGGDYDGDTFWVCWDEHLTKPFRNAPAPIKAPIPSDYDIEVDRRTVADVMPITNNIYKFLRESLDFRLQANLLGQATNLWEKLCYTLASIDSPSIRALCDVHDLLVDCKKNGYSYSNHHLYRLKEFLSLPKLKDPAYKGAMKAIAKWKQKETKLIPKLRSTEYKPAKIRTINDSLFFEHMIPHIEETVLQLSHVFRSVVAEDVALSNPYVTEKERADNDDNKDEVMMAELRNIDAEIKKVIDLWNSRTGPDVDKDLDSDRYNACVRDCFDMYNEIAPLPTNGKDRVVSRLVEPLATGALSEWRLLKASALFIRCLRKTSKSLLFHMAGMELCYLKAAYSGNPRFLTQTAAACMKIRKLISRRAADQNGLDLDDGADVAEDFHDAEEDQVTF